MSSSTIWMNETAVNARPQFLKNLQQSKTCTMFWNRSYGEQYSRRFLT